MATPLLGQHTLQQLAIAQTVIAWIAIVVDQCQRLLTLMTRVQ